MPRKKVVKDDEKDSSSNKKLGRPSGNNKGMEDTHPRLQPGFFRTQVMVYDTSHEPARNEIEFMLSNCQTIPQAKEVRKGRRREEKNN